jgi:hypothetical protein
MKLWPLFLLSLALLPTAALAKKAPGAYPLTYAGGSLPFGRSKVHAALVNDEVIFTQHGQRIAVPAKNITEISCGTEVHRRLGASVLDVVPLMHLGEIENHYIGVGWTDANGSTARAQVLLKLSRSEYHEFLAALEQLTGIKAVNTNQVPSVVRYSI